MNTWPPAGSRKPARTETVDDAARLELARAVLGSLASEILTPDQQAFVRSPLMRGLSRAVRHWTEGPVDVARFVRRVEKYEQGGSPSMGMAIESDRHALRWSTDTGSQQLADVIDRHYRNANLRFAIAEGMINRLLPPQKDVATPVNDRIAGAEVYGQSLTKTKTAVRLVPDPHALRLRLEARGTVDSDTESTSGPATFYSTGRTNYATQKLFVLTREGLTSEAAVSDAAAVNKLRNVRTRYDSIPLISGLVRTFAVNGHDRSHGFALSEIEHRVAAQARQRMETESTERVATAEARFRHNVLARLRHSP